jgi:HEPN domain-containing protein
MNPITKEWIAKADGDFNSAQRELRARKNPNYDASCFHAQQCVEKYLKARLIEAEIPFPKTHDLTYLVRLLAPVEPLLAAFEHRFRILNDYAVEYRYPGETADKETAKKAFDICKHLRIIIRQCLGFAD